MSDQLSADEPKTRNGAIHVLSTNEWYAWTRVRDGWQQRRVPTWRVELWRWQYLLRVKIRDAWRLLVGA